MTRINFFAPIVLALLATATAQSGQTPGGQGQGAGRALSPEMRARMAQMQPVMDLAQDLRLLPELEKNKATALTGAQAKQLLPIIATLQKARAVTAADARKYLAQIEDKLLNDRQLTALDSLHLQAEEAREARRTQGGQRQGAQGLPRLPGMPGAAFGGRQGAQGQGNQARPAGAFDPANFNPFKAGRDADALKAYVATLQKK
ncbi:hypothetical protein [uncultured Deinococcus sp.]|uniref:hypothetical protein n=1 Tax=uncultured Deinococcus sp. TaxID=158789 RepID=UPI002585F5F4|nr:hypothetical protein [uncultured Deinococcus sp.]